MKFDLEFSTTKKTWWVNTKEYIVLHHTGWTWFEWTMNYCAKSSAEVSWHYTIWKKWEIWKVWKDDDILWHAGDWNLKLNWIRYYNPVSIWIEIVSLWKGYNELQRSSVKKLVTYLMKKYSIPKENIIRHLDLTTRKWDVWDNFWNKKFETFDSYINNTYWSMKESEIYRKFDRLKLFNTTQGDYSKEVTAWDIKDLIEVWLRNLIKKAKKKELRRRKQEEK